MTPLPKCLMQVPKGWHLQVRLTPNAKRAGISPPVPDSSGQNRLQVRVTAIPEKGKANKALIAHLAKWAGLPKSCITLIRGDTDRHKTLLIADEGGQYGDCLKALLQELPDNE